MDDRDTAAPESARADGAQPVHLGPPDEDGVAVAHPLATATVELVDGAVVVRVRGEIDQLTAPQLRHLLVEQISLRPRLVVADLDGITFMASSGLAALIAARDAAAQHGVPLRLARLPRVVQRLFAMTNLTSWFASYEDVPQALA